MAEKDDWQKQEKRVDTALDYWIDFLGLVDGKKNPIAASCKKCLLCIIRLISWVESQHGTAGANQPARDPMQSGNPGDIWWKELTGQPTDSVDRIVTGAGKKNYDAPDVPGVVAKDPKAPKNVTPLPKDGHKDKSFGPEMSYFWGILLLLQRLNQTPDGSKTYLLADCSWKHLVDAAVAYNGGGDAEYRNKINKAAKAIKCCDEIDEKDEKKEEKGK